MELTVLKKFKFKEYFGDNDFTDAIYTIIYLFLLFNSNMSENRRLHIFPKSICATGIGTQLSSFQFSVAIRCTIRRYKLTAPGRLDVA